MKLSRVTLLALVAVLSVGWARANITPPDPSIKIVGENSSFGYTPLGPGTTTFAVIFAPCPSGFNGDGCAGFENDTGSDITSIGLTINYHQAVGGQALTCTSIDLSNPMDIFPSTTCPDTVPATNPFSVVYFGATIPTEVQIDPSVDPAKFAIVASQWGLNAFNLPDITVGGLVNAPVPEPGTMALLLSGIGAMAALRKLRKGRGSRA
jgi:PEP-CTERM motif-containing protein